MMSLYLHRFERSLDAWQNYSPEAGLLRGEGHAVTWTLSIALTTGHGGAVESVCINCLYIDAAERNFLKMNRIYYIFKFVFVTRNEDFFKSNFYLYKID